MTFLHCCLFAQDESIKKIGNTFKKKKQKKEKQAICGKNKKYYTRHALRTNAFWQAQIIRNGVCLFFWYLKFFIFRRQIESEDWNLSMKINPPTYSILSLKISHQEKKKSKVIRYDNYNELFRLPFLPMYNILHKFPLLYYLHVLSATLNKSRFLTRTFLISNLDRRLFPWYKFLSETIQSMLTEYYCRGRKKKTQHLIILLKAYTHNRVSFPCSVFSFRKQLKIRSERKRSANYTPSPSPPLGLSFIERGYYFLELHNNEKGKI